MVVVGGGGVYMAITTPSSGGETQAEASGDGLPSGGFPLDRLVLADPWKGKKGVSRR